MEWKDVDWAILRALRDRFLQPRGPQDYWLSPVELEHYDLAFAPRIASKWEAVWLEILPQLPDSVTVLDWACGTGIAPRTLQAIAPGKLRKVFVWDRSK